MTNVPYLYAFCFENGNNRSLVLINTDLSNSHTVSFSGTHPPTGTVNVRQLAPSALDEMNEAPSGSPTNLAAPTVAIETSTLSNPSSITLPPFSATALDYTTTGSGIGPISGAAATPVLSLAGGTYATAQSVTIGDATPGATIYYTTNGAPPSTSSAVYTGPIQVSATETLQAIAAASGFTESSVAVATYTIGGTGLPAPVFAPAPGTYNSAQTVTISDSAAGATIFYTTNGSTPSTSSTVYSGPINVGATETLQAIAAAPGFTSSAVASAAYTIGGGTGLPAPVFTPAPGTYTSSQQVTITDSVWGPNIYYTTDGSTPTASSTQYMGPIWQSSSQTLKAIAIQSGSSSAVTTAAYAIAPVLPVPAFSLPGGIGAYPAPQTVSILDAVPGTTIYYTTDGSTPTTSSTLYSGPIRVSTTEIVEAIAFESGFTKSAVATILYTIASTTLPALAPSFQPAGGSYSGAQSVTLSDVIPGATIYYTTDGTTPTASSAIYGGPLWVSTSETIEAIAIQAGGSSSPVSTAAYTIGVSGGGGTTYIGYPSGGFTANNLSLNNGAFINGGYLELTDGNGAEARSAWYARPLPVTRFSTDFTFLQLNATADGMTFAIQGNDGFALGYPGLGLGYQGIPLSVAVKFDLYNDAGEGSDSTGLYLGGARRPFPQPI